MEESNLHQFRERGIQSKVISRTDPVIKSKMISRTDPVILGEGYL